MKRQTFKMYLKPGCEAEYEKRHNALWGEMKALLKKTGVSDYSIFLDKKNHVLYTVQKVVGEEGSQDLGGEEIVRKWWAYMADSMETNPDNSLVSVPLEEVFYLE